MNTQDPSRKWDFHRYGVSLSKFIESDIEMVRQWRNTPKISQQMLDKTYITEKQQQTWYQRLIQDESQQYFLAYFKEQAIGVVSLTKIDLLGGTAEPGMYIYNDDFINNIVPFCVAFALNDFAFEELQLKRLYGKIYHTNRASIRFHEASGYQVDKHDENTGLQLIHLDKQAYDLAKQKITHFIRY